MCGVTHIDRFPLKNCPVCGKDFTPHRNRHGFARFCRACLQSRGPYQCQQIASGFGSHTCQKCGTVFSGRKKKYCSTKCKCAARVRDPVKERERKRKWYNENGGKEWAFEYKQRPEIKQKLNLQHRIYKATHPEKIAQWDRSYRKRRNERIAKSADGTAGRAIAQLMRLKHCQYCGHRFTSNAEKRIDHRDPVAYGGQHSAANLELCCDACNSRKAATPFAEWVTTLPEPYRAKAVARAEKARGSPLVQNSLPLFGGAVVKAKTLCKIKPAKAKADAYAAWHKWLHEMASDDWLNGYYESHPKPWTDYRLTQSQAFCVRYKADPSFARRWNDRRNKRRKLQRAEKSVVAIKA